jgi:hypothetical protein
MCPVHATFTIFSYSLYDLHDLDDVVGVSNFHNFYGIHNRAAKCFLSGIIGIRINITPRADRLLLGLRDGH